MANENGKTPTQAQPQMIPLSKIHELPGVFNPKPQDKSLGSMVLSIESSGIKEPVILRQRDDGEYQLLSGYRRRRASELAKKQDIPAHVYEMTVQEAIAYRKAVKNDPNAPIPGKLIDPNAEKSMTAEAVPPVAGKDDKGKKGEAPAAPGDKNKQGEAPTAPGDKNKQGEAPAAPGDKDKQGEAPAAPGDKDKEDEAPAAPGDKDKEGEAPTTPTIAELEARAKAGERISLTELAAAGKAEREAKQGKAAQTAAAGKDKPSQPTAADKGKETDEAPTAAIEGPSGTSITQIFEKRLSPPDEESLPLPTCPPPRTLPPLRTLPRGRSRRKAPLKGGQERPEVTKVILTGDRLRKYFPDVSMTPREIEESVYSALEERRQRQMKEQQKAAIFKKSGPSR